MTEKETKEEKQPVKMVTSEEIKNQPQTMEQEMQQKQKQQEQQAYAALAKEKNPPRPIFFNCVKAFIIGGLICVFGELLRQMFINYFGFPVKEAANPTVAVLIIISITLTGLGLYDKIAQFAGAGTAVPITGFANSMSSAAIEHRTEGLVLGVGCNMFKLAGSVIVFGVVSAFFVALIKYVIMGGNL